MRLIDGPIALKDLSLMAEVGFGNLVKAVVDVEREIYPDLAADERIEFDSMINIRPSQGNRSRGVDDSAIRARIVRIVDALVRP